MKSKRWFYFAVLSFCISIFALCTLGATTVNLVPRPPQYVLFSFDDAQSLAMWKETLDFSKSQDLKFTYFISGVYSLLDSNKAQYIEPTHGSGQSAIGFGGKSLEDLHSRVDWINTAYDDGHEIASHANGHFYGGKWTSQNWESEFDQFNNLIFGVFKNNAIFSLHFLNPYHFNKDEIRGFRAPLLSQNSAMYESLRRRAYTYDTSQVSSPTYWPEKINGIWNFPLAEVRLAGTGKKTLSMDYNFYSIQSGGKPDSENFAKYKTEMTDTYYEYFFKNYYGNRAPVHIGNHFSKWNGGAYWEAMKDFAREVCHLPEVNCATYSELNRYMDSLSVAALDQYRKGNFEKFVKHLVFSSFENRQKSFEIDLKITTIEVGKTVEADIFGKNAAFLKSQPNSEIIWKVDGHEIQRGNLLDSMRLDLVPYFAQLDQVSKLSVSVELEGKEILKATHTVIPISLQGSERIPVLSADADEDRVLMGDLPEAHFDE